MFSLDDREPQLTFVPIKIYFCAESSHAVPCHIGESQAVKPGGFGGTDGYSPIKLDPA